nr:hypothetical protein [Tanacetum cinerariifolium]
THTESEPFEGKARTSQSPHIVAPPTCHVEELESCGTSGARSTSSNSIASLSPDHPLTHTTPALVPILRRTACMVVRIPPAMSPGLSAGIAVVEAMSDLVFRKKFSKEVEESSNSDGESEGAKEEGPIAEDEDLATWDKGLASYGLDDESHGVDDESRGLADEGRGVEFDGLGVDDEEDAVPGVSSRKLCMFEVGQCSSSAPEPERSKRVSESRQPTLTTWTNPKDALPMATSTATIPVEEDQFIEVGAQLELYRSILQDHTQRLDMMPPTMFAVIDRDVRELYTQSRAVREEIFS